MKIFRLILLWILGRIINEAAFYLARLTPAFRAYLAQKFDGSDNMGASEEIIFILRPPPNGTKT